MKRNTLKRPQLQIPQLKDPKRISTLLAVSIFTFDPTFEVSRIIDLNLNLGSDRELGCKPCKNAISKDSN